jgi:sulfite reductase (NADPH) flavoprotein alpha-component
LGAFVTNDMSAVSAILDATGLSADVPVEIDGQTMTLSNALLQYQDITSITPRFLDWWTDQSGADVLRNLRLEEHQAQRTVFLRTHHVVDTIRQFPALGLAAQSFLSHLRRLQPRLYSIASSMALVPTEVHLTVSPVAYHLFGEPRMGVASRQLSERSPPGVKVPIYVHPSAHFRLPTDDAPIIMIGAGTGVAPYRAFLQEREARGTVGPSWLFFGERNIATDFIYREEWERFLQRGTLTKMDTAFSRDGSNKIYVQHRMLERAAELFSWIRGGAHVYICGDAAHLAPDVDEALITIVADGARTTREVGQTFIRDLQNKHRYHRDVY